MAELDSGRQPAGIGQRAGFGVGCGVLGLIALVVSGLVVGSLLDTFVNIVFAVILGLGLWWFTRKDAPRPVPMDRLTGTSPRWGFARGLIQAGALAVFLGLGVWWLVWVFGGLEDTLGLPAMMLLGNALLAALEVWSLRRRQEEGDHPAQVAA